MPKQKSSSKKKVKRRDRNEKVTSCEGCSKKLDKKSFLYCACTSVCFCSPECQQEHPHKDCPGPPETEFDMTERLQKNIQSSNGSGTSAILGDSQGQELLETVQKPSIAYMFSKGIKHLSKDISAWDYAKMADEGDALGNQACAYLAGSRFRHRILSPPCLDATHPGHGGRDRLIASNKEEDNIPVLESQELAFKYFEKAAKLGHGLSMQSLGTCFDDGVGCRKNRRRCNQWLWRACLQHSKGAIEMLQGRALLPLEINAQVQMIDRALYHLMPGQGMSLGGPNLASLLLAFSKTVQKEKFTLPPFAGTWATATVNNRPSTLDRQGGHRVPLIGSDAVKDLLKKVKFMNSRGHDIKFGYGRRGTSKAATAQTHGAESRTIDNQLFFVPPAAACDESVTAEEHDHWRRQIQELYYSGEEDLLYPYCVHVEKKGRSAVSAFCSICELEAIERLDAVASGSVVLSVDEDLPQRGQAAIFRNKSDGSLKMETWKTYAGGEAECVLAILAASGLYPYVAPIFIAQDPNFFWPIIADHGCIRAALEFVAPHIDWDEKIGSVKENMVEQNPVIPDCRPGKHLRKCGNSFCTKLEDYKAKGFLLCGRCERRGYCCADCRAADWSVHRLECKTNLNANEADPRLDEVGEDDSKTLKMKYSLKVQKGQDCVVHGLKAKPQYNGMVGIAGEIASNGRIALTLRAEAENILSIKPNNLYCIGVFCRSRRKKSRVFECVHGLAVCADCYLNFTTINRLAKLKYTGQDITSSRAVDQVNDTYFSSFDTGPGKEVKINEGWPIECVGMEKHTRQRFILKALVETKTPMSLHAEVAKTAYVTYGAAFTDCVLRAYTNLEKVAQML